jgi:uncharacterized protein YdiU (UPF0061 family)
LQQPLLSLGPEFYREVEPRPITNPELVRCDAEAAELVGLTPSDLEPGNPDRVAWLNCLSGGPLPPGCRPLALDYAGHQLGAFNPLLGDGRVLALGSLETRRGPLEINVKGLGRTPYARRADGRAGLTECLHEFEMSRRLAALEIPVARALCVIAGDEQVDRDGFERAAVLIRLAPTHLRFGTFENCFFKRDADGLRRLADYLIRHHYEDRLRRGRDRDPERDRDRDRDRYAQLFHAIVLDTADLIAHWQAAGFVHGMMNTDNQSAVGITLDLGAAAFTEDRDHGFVASPVDEKGRYAFGAQPTVGLWNCNALARALSPIVPAPSLRAALRRYEPTYLERLGRYQALYGR